MVLGATRHKCIGWFIYLFVMCGVKKQNVLHLNLEVLFGFDPVPHIVLFNVQPLKLHFFNIRVIN